MLRLPANGNDRMVTRDMGLRRLELVPMVGGCDTYQLDHGF